MVFARDTDHKFSLDKDEPAEYHSELESLFGKTQSVADTCYVFEEWDYDEEVQIAGTDAYNFQGVNCPHNLAKI